jgi:hypothetical protein
VLVHLDSRSMVMEVENRSGMCNNSPAEWTSPENGLRYNGVPILNHWFKLMNQWVGGRRGCEKVLVWTGMKRPWVQILVVVATIQKRILKTEVEMGSMWTVIGHGLTGPEGKRLFFDSRCLLSPTGNWDDIPK